MRITCFPCQLLSSLTLLLVITPQEALCGTFSASTPGPGTWTVPAGVSRISVTATGGGGGGGSSAEGGAGGTVSAELSVSAGQTVRFLVGGGGGANPGLGGGGGGATELRIEKSNLSLDSDVVAGGGGGGAGARGGNGGGGDGGKGDASSPARGGIAGRAGAAGIGGVTSTATCGTAQAGRGLGSPAGGPGGDGSGNIAPSVGGRAQFSNGYIGGSGGAGYGPGAGGSAAEYSRWPTYTGTLWCFAVGGGGGGGFGGGGAGGGGSPLDGGGGGGGSFGPTNSSFGIGQNGGLANKPGGNGSIVITYAEPNVPGSTIPAPRITAFSPATGSTVGGSAVVIQGNNLNTATTVSFGGIAASSVEIASRDNPNTSIRAVVPPGNAGPAVIAVTTPGGTARSDMSFTYVSPPPPAVAEVSNAASYWMGKISPGAIAIIWGSNLGPRIPLTAPAGAVGSLLPLVLDGTSVSIGGTPAPLLYVAESQIGVVVPYETSFTSTAAVTVTRNGVRSSAKNVNITKLTLGIFSANSSGVGLAAAVNEDGTVVSFANPAKPGKIVSLFATGEGLLLLWFSQTPKLLIK